MKIPVFVGAFIVILASKMTADVPVQLPSLSVVSATVPGENKTVGDYAQPEWSARRPFPGVSVYVQPAEQIEFEAGFRDATTRTGFHQQEWSQELEVGLGHRLQLAAEHTLVNFYESARAPRWHEDATNVSVRYALANWGKLPLNPAVGVCWRFNCGAPDAPSGQLVLGDEITPRVHWAADFRYERQAGGPRRQELSTAAALTYSVTNETLNVGLQGQRKQTRDKGEPTSSRIEIGPCVQYRPRDQLHLDCVVLWGTERSHAVRTIILSFGFEFGKGADDHDDDRERAGRIGR